MSATKVGEGNEIVHLHRDLYLIPRSLIRYSDGHTEIAGIKFVNPRHTLVNGKVKARGMERIKMDAIRNSIQKQGLKHPLIVFGKPTGNQVFLLLSGERRKRSIDKLCEENTLCNDPENGQEVAARQIFSHIECRITQNPDLKSLYKEAFTINDTSEGIGEEAVVSLVKGWTEEGWTEAEIMDVTGMSITWLRDTQAIIGLDEKSYEAFLAEDINRTVAIALAETPDMKDRQLRVARLKELAAQRHFVSITQAQGELEEAETKMEIAEANVRVEEGNRSARKQTEAALRRAQKNLSTKEEKVKAVKSRKAKATGKDLEKLSQQLDGTTRKRLTPAKIKKHWIPILEKAERGEEEGICPHDAKLVRAIVSGFDKNEHNLAKMLRDHHASKNATSS